MEVRVLRIVEYIGEAAAVQDALDKAIHGTVLFQGGPYGDLEVRAATIEPRPNLSRRIKVINEGKS